MDALLRNRLRFFWRQMNLQFRTRVLSGYTLILLLVQPLIFSGVGYALARSAGSETPDLIYTIVGGGIMGLWSGMLFTSLYDITLDRVEGTLELIVGSPTSLNTVLAARVLTNVLTSAASLVAAFVVAAAGFRFTLTRAALPSFAMSLIIVLAAFWCMGVFLANFHAWSRITGTMANYLEMPVAVVSGFMFPVSVLPVWLVPLATILPLPWAVAALNASLTESAETFVVRQDWLIALGLSLFYLLLARRLGRFVHDKIRLTGELHSI